MLVGLSSCGKELNESLFRNYYESGLTYMEISCEAEQYDAMNFEDLEKWANAYNVCLWSCHLPFWPFTSFDISSLDDQIRERTIAYHIELVQKCSAIGVNKFVLHPSGEPILDENRKHYMEKAKESIAVLAEEARKCNAIIVVENLPRSCLGRCSDEILDLVGVHPNAQVCFDTNHLMIESPEDFIRKVGKRIITTHVSDFDFMNERHWLPGEGKINWDNLYRSLRDINYDGVWMYEVSFNCPNTILRDRPLCCFDFVRNAEELFSGKPFTVHSQPKPNLGMWG